MQHAMNHKRTRQEEQRLRNNRTGLLIFQLAWILVFVSLVMINLLVRGNYAQWPPPGVAAMPAGLPVLATILLVGSSLAAHAGFTALVAGDRARFGAAWAITLAAGLIFAVIMAVQWLQAAPGNQYGDMFRLMVAYHLLHAVVIGVVVLRAWRLGRAGAYAADTWGAEAALKLWDFVTVAWLLFFVVLYLI